MTLSSIARRDVQAAVPSVGTAKLLIDVLNGITNVQNVRHFGAVGDGVADDTAAFQAAFDALDTNDLNEFGWTTSGGTVYIPPGRFKITSTINNYANNTRIIGESGPDDLGRNTVIEFTGSGSLFSFPESAQGRTGAGFTASGFIIVGTGANAGQTAFSINTGDAGAVRFRRDFKFDRIGVFYMARVFDVWATSTDTELYHSQVGHLTIDSCEFKWNNQAFRFSGQTSCNRLWIVNNNISNNHLGAADNGAVLFLRAKGATISNNIFEGQDDTLKLEAQSEDISITNNFFESLTGYAIHCRNVTRLVIEDNRYFDLDDGDGMFEIHTCDEVTLREPVDRVNDVVGNSTNIHQDVSGVATITSGNTTIVVTHGAITPSINNIHVTPTSDIASAAKFWVNTVTATQFTINVDADPTSSITFAWSIR